MKILGKYVTAQVFGQNYPLQGWVIHENPLIIKHSDGTKTRCTGEPTIVINPPRLPNNLLK